MFFYKKSFVSQLVGLKLIAEDLKALARFPFFPQILYCVVIK